MNQALIPKIAVLLVGGKSSRMGSDKFLLNINGTIQWKYMLEELEQFFDVVYIACRANQKKYFPNQMLLIDEIDNIGPIGALYSAFKQIDKCEWIYFVSCDMPNFKSIVAHKLFVELKEDLNVCAPQTSDNKFAEPLASFWHRNTLPTIEASISTKNYALFKCMQALKMKTIRIEVASLLKNINSPDDI